MMSRYWAMRTDRDNTEYIFQELKKGKLRQGWGWKKNLDLNLIRGAIDKEKDLDEDQEDVWRRQRRMHPEEGDSIQKGDYLLLPNLPEIGLWSIVQVTGGYHYEIDDEFKNYGHILKVKLLNLDFPINPHSEYVSANLRKTMTCRGRLWNIDVYKEDIDELISAIKRKKKISEPTTEAKKMLNIYENISKNLDIQLKKNFHGSEFEKPIEKLLEKIYQNVERLSGPSEYGADFICINTDELGVPYKVAIQVKMWDGKAEWKRPLDQIKEAYNEYENISAGVIITTSERVSKDFEKYRKQLESKLNIPIVIVDKDKLKKVLIKYIPEFIEND